MSIKDVISVYYKKRGGKLKISETIRKYIGNKYFSLLLLLAFFTWAVGWKATLALAVIVYIHELGHKYAALRAGLTVQSIEFKLYGGVTNIKGIPKKYKDACIFLLAGPATGIILCAIFYAGYLFTREDIFLGCIGLTTFLNLLNLLPITVADGGGIFDSLLSPFKYGTRRNAMILGNIMAAVVLYIMNTGNFLIAVFLIIGLLESSSGINREKGILTYRARMESRKRECEEMIENAKQTNDNNTGLIEEYERHISEVDEKLAETLVPQKMSVWESVICGLCIVSVAGILLAFYMLVGLDSIKLLMS